MKYCVVKNTLKIIDGSDNPIEIMLQNAQNAGFSEAEVEILTEEEYQTRLENEPKPPQGPTEIEILQEENDKLKTRLYATESIMAETSATQEMLIELLLELEVM